MARNKKRTGITIVTLGATGILFMVVATILSCAAPKEIARKDIESDYKIELETWGGDKMNPDRDWRQVQQNNPLTKAFIDQVRDVDGVEEVKVKTFMNGKIPNYLWMVKFGTRILLDWMHLMQKRWKKERYKDM